MPLLAKDHGVKDVSSFEKPMRKLFNSWVRGLLKSKNKMHSLAKFKPSILKS